MSSDHGSSASGELGAQVSPNKRVRLSGKKAAETLDVIVKKRESKQEELLRAWLMEQAKDPANLKIAAAAIEAKQNSEVEPALRRGVRFVKDTPLKVMKKLIPSIVGMDAGEVASLEMGDLGDLFKFVFADTHGLKVPELKMAI
eukprot:3288483-Alexandrium_andersonii.AAC.1